MRVLQVDSGREWRGGQNQVRLLCRELTKHPDVQNNLITAFGSMLADRARADGASVIETSWDVGLSPSAWFALKRAINDFQPDIVHVHDSHSLSLALWQPKKRDPYVLIAHRRVDFHVKRRSGWHRADRIIAVSAGVKRVLVEDGVNERDIVVIHDGIDPDEIRANAGQAPDIRQRLGLPAEAPLAANAAALVDHKDQLTLVRAAAAARARAPQLHWVIAGEGPLRESLQREIANLHVGDIVHLVGYVEPVDALIREASVFVMSSKEEGMGSVALHALALERPVVATAAGGLPEIVPAEWLAPVGDAEALAAKTVQALEHPPQVTLPVRSTAKFMAEAVLAQYRLLA
ncbi:MAG TPA: glycosyltransferase [Gemmatimonadales bacterium]|nr:glycosyltransferase [Gemmatimonadales bacterium]